MAGPSYATMIRNPKFQELVAFGKGFLATRIGSGVMTVGIPLALGVIVMAFVLTAIYVQRANGEFDKLTDELTRETNR